MKRETCPNPGAGRHRDMDGLCGESSLQLYLVGEIQIAVGFTEGHHNRHVAIFTGHMEGGVAMPVLEINGTALVDESLDDLHLTSSHGKM